MNTLRSMWLRLALVFGILWIPLLAGCGEDQNLVYFPPPGQKQPADVPLPSEGKGGRSCNLSFTSELCVTIKGEKIDVGTNPEDQLCAEVPPFPLHITEGTTISLKGDEFPDIKVEGHGLPGAIIINGKGDGTGAENVGRGTIDAAGNISIQGFSFFINALGVAAKIPDLTLTTGATDDLPLVGSVSGSPPDVSGAMTLVTGTVLPHLFDAADKILKGASLIALLTGSISPTLDQCGSGDTPRNIQITKLSIDPSGTQTESPLPDENRLEISTGTYIATGSGDVGPRFEAVANFRVKNIGPRTITLRLPPKIGAFFLSTSESLTRSLEPQKSFVLDVTFRPRVGDVVPGDIIENLVMGTDLFQLKGKALGASGAAEMSSVGSDGSIITTDIDQVEMGEVSVAAGTERAFFSCTEITCHGAKALTSCGPCPDPATHACELLPVSTNKDPLSEVDAQCHLLRPDALPLRSLDLHGTSDIAVAAGKQVLAIRNRGVIDMTIREIALVDVPGSRSKGQFSLPADAIFVADRFADIQEKVKRALSGNGVSGTKLPITLPPFIRGFRETTAYIIVTYRPNDLLGARGEEAGVGSEVTDRAIIRIMTDSEPITATIEGETTIHEVPALELYFKTSTGLKKLADGENFGFAGVTTTTRDLSVPLFLRLDTTAPSAMRITSITIDDPDHFQWLDTADKIAAIEPPQGQGMRCSIPTLDPSTGTMTGESFDLHPVSLAPPGFDLIPGISSTETMPLFGCVNFHRTAEEPGKRLYESKLTVAAEDIDAAGNPVRNPDGSPRKTNLNATLLAAVNPISGQVILRVTQTMSLILNQQFPSMAAISAAREIRHEIAAGRAKEVDIQVFTGAMFLDPFDTMTIPSSDGTGPVSTPNDGITAVFRALDTHPTNRAFEEEFLYDYASLLYDGAQAEGHRGIFESFPHLPDGMRANGWRIFTTALSYPGPLASEDKRPLQPSWCETVHPCSEEGLLKYTDAGVRPGEKGACAFFYASGGRFDSPAFHRADELPGGTHTHLCNAVDQPQKLIDANTGHYTLDGQIVFEEMGLRLFGPTFVHNPHGPAGSVPPLDVIFHTAFTTGTIKPPTTLRDYDLIPDQRIDLARQRYKINLTDPGHANPRICEGNILNRRFGGQFYSSWKYLAPLISKDEEGTIPAGCNEGDNGMTGGTAFLHGRPLDHETGVVTFVAPLNFGPAEDLTFTFQDVMSFIILNGWFCNPQGDEANFEGARCYDPTFNERDAVGQISIMP